MTRPLQVSATLAMLAICLALTGCTTIYGRLSSNPALLAQYRDAPVSPAYRFYYCGRSAIPDAVVGIDPSWEFNDRMWFPIDHPADVGKKIDGLSDLHPLAMDKTASDILDHQGKRIGVYFSYYPHTPVVIDPEKRRVSVFNPYDPNDEPFRLGGGAGFLYSH